MQGGRMFRWHACVWWYFFVACVITGLHVCTSVCVCVCVCVHALCVLCSTEKVQPGQEKGFIKLDNCRLREACLIDFHYPVSSLSHEINTNGIKAHQHWLGSPGTRKKLQQRETDHLVRVCVCVCVCVRWAERIKTKNVCVLNSWH